MRRFGGWGGGDLQPDEMSVLGEYLHSAPLVPAVTDNKLSAALHDGNFPVEAQRNCGYKAKLRTDLGYQS